MKYSLRSLMIFFHQDSKKRGALEFHKQGLVPQLFPKPQLSFSPLPAAAAAGQGEMESLAPFPAAGRGETREFRRNQAP